MPRTIEDLRGLGYEVAFAHGSVETEEQALQHARGHAAPDVLTDQAFQVTTDTIRDLSAVGKLPATTQDRQALAERIAEVALAQLTERAEGLVSFHEQALQIAKDSPDVWVVSGPGFTNVYVACKPDGTGWDEAQQELLEVLGDPKAHREREKQAKQSG